ncbi:MAG: SusE domain-containing protein [Bacteroidales bacterium]|nr:SusE domain-containing protein [Bacteroidales bacterium]
MKNKIYILFIGLLGLLVSCEKDGEQIVMLDNPIAPTIAAMPNLTLERNNGTDVLEFVGTNVDPGFTASAKYFLEANVAGTDFDDPIIILSDVQANSFKITVSDLNGILLKKFPADAVSSVDFRIRAELVTDGGTGAETFEYTSATTTANVTLYGLPRLNLLNSGIDQKIESALGNGDYTGFVKLDATMPFTLVDPDADIEYGDNAGALAVDGSGISVDESGWYNLSANTVDLTYSVNAYMIGLIGSATPNGWNTPDQKMDYDAKTGTWSITIDLVDGEIKFRKNDGWAWNLGGTPDNLIGDGPNLAVSAGNYTITLTITDDTAKTGTCTIVKN